jgi:S-(hydroxymethyl)glutathione dehydrogenase / alcohol dehydrogenase
VRAALLLELGQPLEIEDVEHAVEFAIGARRIIGCQYGGATIRRDVPRFAALLEAGLVDSAPIVDRRFALEQINDALAAAEARQVLTGVVMTG